MGLVLDSGVPIAAERDARPVSELPATLERVQGETEIVLSSITVIELEHGLHRANTEETARKRRDVHRKEMAQTAARIDADAKRDGRSIPFADLLIGGTALHFGYGLGTRNLRHFRMIPGLNVLPL